MIHTDLLNQLEQAFLDKIEAKKKIKYNLNVRINRLEMMKHRAYVRLHRNGYSKWLGNLIKSYDKELYNLSLAFYRIRSDIDAYSSAVCRLREKRRGKCKKSLEWILSKSVLESL